MSVVARLQWMDVVAGIVVVVIGLYTFSGGFNDVEIVVSAGGR